VIIARAALAVTTATHMAAIGTSTTESDAVANVAWKEVVITCLAVDPVDVAERVAAIDPVVTATAFDHVAAAEPTDRLARISARQRVVAVGTDDVALAERRVSGRREFSGSISLIRDSDRTSFIPGN